MPGKLVKQCEACGADMRTQPSLIKRGGGRFCSHDCEWNARKAFYGPAPAEKACSRCKTVKPLDQFREDPRYKFGRHSACFDCRREQIKKAGEKHVVRHQVEGPSVKSKLCANCKIEKPAEDFILEPRKRTGLTSWCRRCSSERAKLSLYGLTPEQFNAMRAAQNNLCAICNRPFKGTPCIDHCHVTGNVRGLLCYRCNTWLPALEHPAFVSAGLRYLDAARQAFTCRPASCTAD